MNGLNLRHVAGCMKAYVRPGELVLAAVSGGADSMALLDILLHVQKECGYRLEVVHVHHHLRAASDAEWQFVADYCAERGVLFHGRHVKVREQARGGSLEAAAHSLRHQVLREVAQERGAKYLALAHQADDRAETVLMNILRGTSLQGLAAMPERDGMLLRPLLAYSKAELEEYCQAENVPFVTDESNSDITILRNRLRHLLLPELAAYNPQVVRALNHLAQSSERDTDYISTEAEKLFLRSTVFSAERWCLLYRDRLLEAHEAVQAALLRKTVQHYAVGRGSLRFEMVEEALARICNGQGSCDLGERLQLECTRRFIYIGDKPEGEWYRDETGIWRHDFLQAALVLPSEINVRTYTSGDTIAQANLGRKSLKKIFQEKALPPSLRMYWPLVCDTKTKEIIWVPFLAQRRQLMYYNSVTFLQDAFNCTIAQRAVQPSIKNEEKER